MESRVAARDKKRIEVKSAALVDLKAALFQKQQQVKQEKQTSFDSAQPNKSVSDKTSSIWRNAKPARKGVKPAAAKEEASLSLEDEELAKSQQALAAKAKQYEELSRGVRRDEHSGGEDEEGSYLVDFAKKIYNEVNNKEFEKPDESLSHSAVDSATDTMEYVDSFGRTRRRIEGGSPPPVLLSEDREQEEWAGPETQPEGPLHYEGVRGGEVRTHGVGYYAFSSDEAKRQEQMKLLDNLKKQTAQNRDKNKKIQEKRKALLEARLAKVKQRKLKQKIESEDNSEGIAAFNFSDNDAGPSESETELTDLSAMISQELKRARESAELAKVKQAEYDRSAHVRPWDKGKAAELFQKRKRQLENERCSDFAPPGSYNETASTAKHAKHENF